MAPNMQGQVVAPAAKPKKVKPCTKKRFDKAPMTELEGRMDRIRRAWTRSTGISGRAFTTTYRNEVEAANRNPAEGRNKVLNERPSTCK